MLNREVSVLNCLTDQAKLPVPNVKKSVEQNNKGDSWALLEFLEGETLRTVLYSEKNKAKRQKMIFNFGALLFQAHTIPLSKRVNL